MKNLKNSLTAIIFAIILTISTGVFAYTGIGNVEIQSMPGTLTDGTATVSNASKYQFVEITTEKYSTIKKLEAQYKLLKAYEAYTSDPTNTSLANAYSAECDSYYAEFGNQNETRDATINSVLNSYTMGSTLSEECKSVWVNELVEFNASNWTDVTDSKIQIDLSTFTGTKYYIAWVETTTSGKYYAEAYKVAGTKVDEPEQPKEEPKNENTPVDNTQKPTNTSSTKKDTTTTAKTIPHTGASSAVLGLLAVTGTAAGISYRKYSKIK